MEKQDFYNEEFISSAPIDSVKKVYKENEEQIIPFSDTYYCYCLRLHDAEDFITDWTLLHPTDYYKLKVKLRQYVPKKELYDYFVCTIGYWCNDWMSKTYIPGSLSLEDWLSIAKDCCYYTLLSFPEIRDVVFMMEQSDMMDELLQFYRLESKTRKFVYNNRDTSLTDKQVWTLYLDTIGNEYKQIIGDCNMDFSLFEKWINLYWEIDDLELIGEDIATYKKKYTAVLDEIFQKYNRHNDKNGTVDKSMWK